MKKETYTHTYSQIEHTYTHTINKNDEWKRIHRGRGERVLDRTEMEKKKQISSGWENEMNLKWRLQWTLSQLLCGAHFDCSRRIVAVARHRHCRRCSRRRRRRHHRRCRCFKNRTHHCQHMWQQQHPGIRLPRGFMAVCACMWTASEIFANWNTRMNWIELEM